MDLNVIIVEPYARNTAPEEFENSTNLGLCCCEYLDRNNQQFHVLACCCNCVDLDLVVTHLVSCKRIDPLNRDSMLLTFQDRLRLPWRGGAKQISLEAVLPAVALPLVIGIGGINAYTAIVMLLACIAFVGYAYFQVQRSTSRTRFFFMWLFWSVLYLIAMFEITVPQMELLPEENFVLVLLAVATIICFYKTKQRAVLNSVMQSPNRAADAPPEINGAATAALNDALQGEEADSQTALLMDTDDTEPSVLCNICHKYMTPRSLTTHCAVCGVCVLRRDHHSFWLDTCVGEWNHRYYVAGLLFAQLTLLLGAYLTLTAVCHPFMVFRVLEITVMLPDDCSEAFDQYEFGLCFVIAVYALIMALYVFVVLTRQIYLISRGLTLDDCQRGQRSNRKTVWANWRAFVQKRST